jgi:hypothetical protein
VTYWLSVLVPPRPTFASDMTDDERALMLEHVRYWRGQMEKGKVLAFGPVLHPRAEFGGVALLTLDGGEDPDAYARADPAILADVGFRFEAFPMPQLVRSDR